MKNFGERASRFAQRYVPDPFVLALMLTILVMVVSLPRLNYDLFAVADGWVNGGGSGLWRFLAFSMQMCLILVTGFALAETPLAHSVVERLSSLPKNTRQATTLVSIFAMSAALINWGLGLVLGALLARKVGESARTLGKKIHYPLVCTAGYTGMAVWHGGFSGSAPLKATSSKQLIEILGAEVAESMTPIPTSASIGSWLNLTVIFLCFIVIPLTLAWLAPDDERAEPFSGVIKSESPTEANLNSSLAHRLNHSFVLAFVPAAFGLVWCSQWLLAHGISELNPNIINLFMLSVGLLLHRSPLRYAMAVQKSISGIAGIVLQYPFYAGIMALLVASGIIADLGQLLAGLSGNALCAATFYSAGLINLLIPSGGGQWAIQGPIIMQAASEAGVPTYKVLMALAYGDQWTNLIQPFWALPLLGICEIRAGQVLGYSAVLLIMAQICFLTPLCLF